LLAFVLRLISSIKKLVVEYKTRIEKIWGKSFFYAKKAEPKLCFFYFLYFSDY